MAAAIGFVLVYAVITYSEGIDLTGHLGGAIGGGIATGLLSIGFTEDYREGIILRFLGIFITFMVCGAAVYFIIGM